MPAELTGSALAAATSRSTPRSPGTASSSPTARSPLADLAAGRLVRPFALSLPDRFAYFIATAPGALDRPKVKAFRDWLREEVDSG